MVMVLTVVMMGCGGGSVRGNYEVDDFNGALEMADG